MAVYNKKLCIKKPNGVIQKANLYTDKADIRGGDCLTFKDGGNIVYSILDANGDIDCKIRKNGKILKVKNTNTIPRVRNGYKVNVVYSITFPKGVKKIAVSTDVNPNDYYIISVTPEKPYRFASEWIHIDPHDMNPDTEYNGYIVNELNYYKYEGVTIGDCNGTYYITYSEEINNVEATFSWG